MISVARPIVAAAGGEVDAQGEDGDQSGVAHAETSEDVNNSMDYAPLMPLIHAHVGRLAASE